MSDTYRLEAKKFINLYYQPIIKITQLNLKKFKALNESFTFEYVHQIDPSTTTKNSDSPNKPTSKKSAASTTPSSSSNFLNKNFTVDNDVFIRKLDFQEVVNLQADSNYKLRKCKVVGAGRIVSVSQNCVVIKNLSQKVYNDGVKLTKYLDDNLTVGRSQTKSSSRYFNESETESELEKLDNYFLISETLDLRPRLNESLDKAQSHPQYKKLIRSLELKDDQIFEKMHNFEKYFDYEFSQGMGISEGQPAKENTSGGLGFEIKNPNINSSQKSAILKAIKPSKYATTTVIGFREFESILPDDYPGDNFYLSNLGCPLLKDLTSRIFENGIHSIAFEILDVDLKTRLCI